MLLALPVAAHAAPPGAPPNDDYLDSFPLNQAGKKLNRTETLRDNRDTSLASVQTDVFAPQSSGGPAEPTTCGSASYGRTVWYDFYPDVTGFVRLRANGYNTALSVVPFNRRTARPSFAQRQCFNDSASTTEEFFAKVAKGRSYTIQIGAVGDVGGRLEFLFDFLADTDGDNVLNDVDKCDRLKGTAREAGCPVRLKARRDAAGRAHRYRHPSGQPARQGPPQVAGVGELQRLLDPRSRRLRPWASAGCGAGACAPGASS